MKYIFLWLPLFIIGLAYTAVCVLICILYLVFNLDYTRASNLFTTLTDTWFTECVIDGLAWVNEL
jgi:hypothetical protein